MIIKNCGKKVLTAVIVFVVCSFAMSVYAEPADIQKHWARNEINRWIGRGILQGDANGSFKPDDAISRAEFAAIINRIFKYQDQSGTVFSDIKGGEWYAADIDRAAAAGILKGSDGKARPKDPVSRQEAAVMLVRAFSLEAADKDAVKGFKDAAFIPAWSRDALNAMFERGYISGRPGNMIAPADKTSRAEAVKMIDNVIEDLKSKPGTYTGTIDGNLVVNTADTALEAMVINGDLYLAQGIGSGGVTLDNVVVKGRTIVNGGGDHSIVIKNSSLNGKLIVYKSDGKIRIVAEGSTEIPAVLMQSGGTLEEKDAAGGGFGGVQVAGIIAPGQEISLDGNFDEVSVEAPDIGVQLTDGTVDSLEMADSAAGSVVNILETAAVETLILDSAVEIKGKGGINNANFNSDGVAMEQTPTVINKKDGVALPSNLQAAEDDAGSSGGGSGGGGGGLPAETLKVVSAKAKVGDTWIEAVADEKQDGVWEIDLSGEDPVSMFTDLKVYASADVVSAEVSYIGISRTIDFSGGSGTANVHAMLGAFDTGDPGVSVQSIQSLGETEFTVTIGNGSGSTKSVTIRLVV